MAGSSLPAISITRGPYHMKTMFKALLAMLVVAFCGTAFGQDINSTSNSSVSSGAMSSAANQGNNQGQAITFNSPAVPTHTTETVRAAPSMGLGSFGTSFSSDNCSNTIAGQLSVVGVGASYGKALQEENCARIRRGYAFGQAAAFAAANHQPDLANKAEAMVFYEFCMAAGKDSDDVKACESLGLVNNGQPVTKQQAVAVQQQQQETPPQMQVSQANISVVRTGYNQSGTTGH